MLLALLAALAVSDPAVVPEGSRLAEGEACYVINAMRDGVAQPIGVAWQTVERGEENGRAVLRVTVHQRVGDRFDMRDRFTLDANDLRPITLINDRLGAVHVEAAYADDRITGQRIDDGETKPIDVALDGPLWEGNLFGLTFAALPLAEGASFELPYWQYDKGFGAFSVSVTGLETVETPDGPVEAWVLDAGSSPDSRMTYLISKADNRELGYRSPRGSQMLGGDCSALKAAS